MRRKKNPTAAFEELRMLLLAKRAELLANARMPAPVLRDAARVADDDQAPLLLEEYIATQTKRLDYLRVREIDAALDRMNTGDYGICAECGQEISPKRLLAIPWAECCVACQEKTTGEAA